MSIFVTRDVVGVLENSCSTETTAKSLETTALESFFRKLTRRGLQGLYCWCFFYEYCETFYSIFPNKILHRD